MTSDWKWKINNITVMALNNKNNHLIFVYGTLRKNHTNHRFLKNSTFIGKGKTKEKYALYIDVFPYVRKEESVSRITGEVYEVNDYTLNLLDVLEDHPTWYKREQIQILLDNGTELTAWLYFNSYSEGKLSFSGDYLNNIQ